MLKPETAQLDFAADEGLSGFRLQRFELLNWDIGSGKSTLVDALTTLLVPHQRIVYNKAAGAEGRERSLASYVRGEYKSEQDEATQGARAVALRDENSYSVLLAWFHNQGFDQGASLAQVFWHKDGQRKPERLFVFADRPLTIKQHFSGFGNDIQGLRKQLRKQTGVELFDNFKAYAGRFRRLFGIQQEQALELFYQTVSMKSVGNLTEFVRSHMRGEPHRRSAPRLRQPQPGPRGGAAGQGSDRAAAAAGGGWRAACPACQGDRGAHRLPRCPGVLVCGAS
jgi:uncharacterized protein YPO0396